MLVGLHARALLVVVPHMTRARKKMKRANKGLVTGEYVEGEQNELYQSNKIPSCQECDSKSGVKPSMHSYRGPYFCIQCCNYLDMQGKVFVEA